MDTFTREYLGTALWAETDEDGEPLDSRYSVDDFDAAAIDQAMADCAAFLSAFGAEIQAVEPLIAPRLLDLAAHDLWLTRNGHGAGFWDGDWPEPLAARLTEAAHALGELYVYAGDDERMHLG